MSARPWWQTAVVWLLMGTSSLLNLVPPYLSRPLMDRVLVPKQAVLSLPDRLSLLGWLVLGLLAAQAAGPA